VHDFIVWRRRKCRKRLQLFTCPGPEVLNVCHLNNQNDKKLVLTDRRRTCQDEDDVRFLLVWAVFSGGWWRKKKKVKRKVYAREWWDDRIWLNCKQRTLSESLPFNTVSLLGLSSRFLRFYAKKKTSEMDEWANNKVTGLLTLSNWRKEGKVCSVVDSARARRYQRLTGVWVTPLLLPCLGGKKNLQMLSPFFLPLLLPRSRPHVRGESRWKGSIYLRK